MTFDLPSGDQILNSLHDKMEKERKNLWKEIKQRRHKSPPHSSQQAGGKSFQILTVEPDRERDSKSRQRRDKELIDKPQQATEEKYESVVMVAEVAYCSI